MKREAKIVKMPIRDSVKATEPRKATAMEQISKALKEVTRGVFLF